MTKNLLAIFLAIFLAIIGMAAASSTYYVIYNIPVECGSNGPDEDVTELPSSVADCNHTLLRIFEVMDGNKIALPPTVSKLTLTQWLDVENQTGSYDNALVLFEIDEVQDMR